jgi:hypothetical protein
MATRTPKPRLLVLTGDHHFGGTGALLPPNFRTLEGQTIGQNSLQKWMWECWEDAWRWVDALAANDPWGLVLMGDEVEGNHHRTKEIISPDDSDHFKAAVQALKPIVAKAHSTFVIEGTECHTHNMEAALGEKLGCRINPETGLHVFGRLALDVCGVRFVARHHIPATSRPYLEASQLSIQLGVERIECVRRNETPPRILASAHRHRPGDFCDRHGISLVTHAWQGLTRHGRKVVPAGSPLPGIYVLDWRGIPDGQLPQLHVREYEPPQAKPVAL